MFCPGTKNALELNANYTYSELFTDGQSINNGSSPYRAHISGRSARRATSLFFRGMWYRTREWRAYYEIGGSETLSLPFCVLHWRQRVDRVHGVVSEILWNFGVAGIVFR